jgi:nicotinamide riboside kinase
VSKIFKRKGEAADPWLAAHNPGTVHKVAVIGAECTGKSTLCQNLAAQLPGIYIPEALRDFCAAQGRTPTVTEQRIILQDQLQQEALALLRARHQALSWILCDSSPLITALYSQIYFADNSLAARALAHHKTYNLTLLMDTDLPWEPDGIQRDGPQMRQTAQDKIIALLHENGIAHAVISGEEMAREEAALAAIVAGFPQQK